MARGRRKIRVLVVDDSFISVRAITRMLKAAPDVEVVGSAPDGEQAIRKVAKLKPDVVTMDINMPGMDGLLATRRIVRQYGVPVVVVSAHANERRITIKTIQALFSGAVETVQKPSGEVSLDMDVIASELLSKIHIASGARLDMFAGEGEETEKREVSAEAVRVSAEPAPARSQPDAEAQTLNYPALPPKLIIIGGSTGGAAALQQLLAELPTGFRTPIAAVIHMSGEQLVDGLVDALLQVVDIPAQVVKEETTVLPGTLYLAPSDRHVRVSRQAGKGIALSVDSGERVWGCRPSVDVLFSSAAEALGSRAVGIILTGMGRDGAEGLLKMHNAGAMTFGQDEATSVVYGMPRVAVERGAVQYQLPVRKIGRALCRFK